MARPRTGAKRTVVAAIRQITISDRNQLNPGTWPADMGAWQGQTK